MSRQRLTIPVLNPFTGVPPHEIWDNIILFAPGNVVQSGRTQGLLVITDLTPALAPSTINSKYSLVSISAQAYLGLFSGNGLGSAIGQGGGRLGSIQAGLYKENEVSGSVPSGVEITPNGTNAILLPQDNTLTVTLWDPGVDALPPIFDAPPNVSSPRPSPQQLLPISGAITPAVSIPIIPVVKYFAGIWINYSTFFTTTGIHQPFSVGLFLRTASYTVDYDDGL